MEFTCYVHRHFGTGHWIGKQIVPLANIHVDFVKRRVGVQLKCVIEFDMWHRCSEFLQNNTHRSMHIARSLIIII